MNKYSRTVTVTFVLILSTFLGSCGIGVGNTPANIAPVSEAGSIQNVATGSLVTLDGSNSSDANGDILTYSWSFTSIPAGSTAALSSSTVVNPTFTADKDGAYVFSLVVNDGKVNSIADTITITAATANSAPVANAGPDQNVATGSLVTLDGSNSSDANGDILTYSWSFTSIPAGSAAALSSSTVVNPTFTADKDGAYVLSLVVNDGKVNSIADTITITAATANSAPVANAGPDQNVATGSLVTLDGSNSSDANGDRLTYSWSFTSIPAGSAAALSSSTVVNPAFTADKDGAYVFSLVVNDGKVNSTADTVLITATTADTTAPTVPKGLTASTISASQIDLKWSASSDVVGVAGYSISRDGAYLKSVVSTSTSDSGLAASTQYCYQVSAYDAAGNISAGSSQSCATTSAQSIIISGSTLSFTKVVKYFVNNTVTLTPPTDFLVLHNKTEFDLTFSPFPPPSVATQFDMTNRFVLSIIKNGNTTWALDVQSVTLDSAILKVYYSASKLADNLTWTSWLPLNILLDTVSYTKIQFFENGNCIKEL